MWAASVRRFCAAARAQFEGCTDFASKRQFLRDHIEAVIFDHGRITVVGSVNDLKLPFRIEGQIDRASIRLNSSRERGATFTPNVQSRKTASRLERFDLFFQLLNFLSQPRRNLA
jgi:hypothetical protein